MEISLQLNVIMLSEFLDFSFFLQRSTIVFNASSAREQCRELFALSQAVDRCSSLVIKDVEEYIDHCTLDLQVIF